MTTKWEEISRKEAEELIDEAHYSVFGPLLTIVKYNTKSPITHWEYSKGYLRGQDVLIMKNNKYYIKRNSSKQEGGMMR